MEPIGGKQGHAFEKLACIITKHTLEPYPRVENTKDTVTTITFTLVSTLSVTVPTLTIKAPKKTPSVLLE